MIHARETAESPYGGKLVWHQILCGLMLRHYWNFFILLMKFHLMIHHIYLSRVIRLLQMRYCSNAFALYAYCVTCILSYDAD